MEKFLSTAVEHIIETVELSNDCIATIDVVPQQAPVEEHIVAEHTGEHTVENEVPMDVTKVLVHKNENQDPIEMS